MTMIAARIASLALIPAAFAAAPALAQSAPDTAFRTTTFSLAAAGETLVAPDMATISLGVQTDDMTAAGALKANAAKMTQVMAVLRKAGIAERDIQTSNLNVNPQYVYEQNQPPRFNGYQVSNQVTVTVRDLARLGQALDATVAAGANTVGGISFGLQNPQAAEDAARMDAVKALQAKADLYARATGYRIVRLVNLGEGGGYAPAAPMPVFAMAKRDMAESSPIAGGELKVRIDVTATYEVSR
ncbi:SIMPL domain-containing protein [Caulobacter henricii]|uniref:SIMPL domain-containing protein n=1 Tax=Caulobacter henricii TaxID=69395 RepID=A0A0P0NYQ7_9CAUL|nr:SIMPL domain-containing protein [Caulobacter henricii]ALL12928.1 hypothetical protein AQ619_05930 [Caulobacter henricii]